MTISRRRGLYKLFFGFSVAVLVLAATALISGGAAGLANTRYFGLHQGSQAQFVAGITAGLLCLAAGLACNAVIALGIGKSISVEIFFCSLWALSLSLEAGRLLILGLSRAEINMAILTLLTRVVLFGRYIGLSAMFMASIFSNGFKQERLNPTIMIIIFFSLLFASIQPLNTGAIDNDFLMARGYRSLSGAFDLAIIGLIAANYLIAWRNNGNRTFLLCGLASLAMLGGAYLLRGSPSWLLLIPALAAMGAGAWVYLKNMYVYYLWR